MAFALAKSARAFAFFAERIFMKTRCYSELARLPTFEERFNYLKLNGEVGSATFGFDRYLNQAFYNSAEWKRARDEVIIRDCGCDLGIIGREIGNCIIIHHMNPISESDLRDVTDILLNPEYLICVSHRTHNAIHYGDENLITKTNVTERFPNDTCPWKK